MPEPRVGHGVWVEGQSQPNGRIVNIDWHDKEVHVLFYDLNIQEAFEWDQFDTFNDRLNQWIIHR